MSVFNLDAGVWRRKFTKITFFKMADDKLIF